MDINPRDILIGTTIFQHCVRHFLEDGEQLTERTEQITSWT